MFYDYMKEVGAYDALELPDVGFTLYRIVGQECHIGHMYVKPEHRKGSKGREMAQAVEAQALAKGCTELSCVVQIQAGDEARQSYLTYIYLKYGFGIVQASPGSLILTKRL